MMCRKYGKSVGTHVRLTAWLSIIVIYDFKLSKVKQRSSDTIILKCKTQDIFVKHSKLLHVQDSRNETFEWQITLCGWNANDVWFENYTSFSNRNTCVISSKIIQNMCPPLIWFESFLCPLFSILFERNATRLFDLGTTKKD